MVSVESKLSHEKTRNKGNSKTYKSTYEAFVGLAVLGNRLNNKGLFNPGQLAFNQLVAGSNPARPTILKPPPGGFFVSGLC